jgi:hypothetical protein
MIGDSPVCADAALATRLAPIKSNPELARIPEKAKPAWAAP